MVQVLMPQLGESVTEGTILQWLKQPGDRVELDDPLCEIETEKVTAELPSPFEGTMGRILVQAGETVDVGVALCEIEEVAATTQATDIARSPVSAAAGKGWSGGPMAIPPDEPPADFPPPAANGARVATTALSGGGRKNPEDRSRYYSPAVMRLAAEHGIDLSAITGTGVGGRITRKDVEAFVQGGGARQEAPAPAATATIEAPPAPTAAPRETAPRAATGPAAGYEVVTFSPTRQRIAENLRRATLEAPQAWTMVEVDVTGLVRLREREKERFERQEGVPLTLLPYFTQAVCACLREFPALNARWEGEELRQYHALNIGVAVAAESGLVVPVIHDAQDLSIAGLAKRIADLAARAHARRLRVEDIEGGTFTVNNTGAFGSIASQPIVNYPQVAIVTMERVVRRPVVREDESIAVRAMMNVCLSFDHRVADGLEAGGFLAALKRRLEAIA